MSALLDAMAERLAAGHYYVYAKPRVIDQYPFSEYPGRQLMIDDARRWLRAAEYCGLAVVEAEGGR